MLHIDFYITIYILTVAGILGAVFGSFINCMSWRIANKESVLKGRSHCTSCNHTLGLLDLIPVFSYILLKGKCRYCKRKISPRYMLVELIMALTFILVVLKYDVTLETVKYLVFICILMGLSLVDFEIYEIPDRFIAFGIIWWIVMLPFSPGDIWGNIKLGAIAAFAFGGGMLLLSIIFDKVTGKESLGGGDIKLFFLVGLFLGPWVSLLNLIIACFLGLVLAAVLKSERIPFGPSISGATFISLIWGQNIVNWYLGLF